MPDWNDFVEWTLGQATEAGGRKALRRRWEALRKLAGLVAEQVTSSEIEALLGKPYEQLDPEHNDLKALVAYGAGKGIVTDPNQLQQVLRDDTHSDPLHFLARYSGKTFGEKYAPLIAKFWLAAEGDTWRKQPSKGYYDVGWMPLECSGKEIRIELKASSEHPSYRFQQVRHPRLSGTGQYDYDLLLCLGVSAGSLEWWAIPAEALDELAETGAVARDHVVITYQHGKRRPIWNEQYGHTDEGWFTTNAKERLLLKRYACGSSDLLRAKVLALL